MEDYFKSPVFIENGKLCGIESMPIRPLLHLSGERFHCVVPVDPDGNVVYPTFLSFLNTFTPMNMKLGIAKYSKNKTFEQTYALIGASHLNMMDSAMIAVDQIHEIATIRTKYHHEYSLITGLLDFFNTYIATNSLTAIGTNNEFDNVFNDTSIESMFRTVIIHHTDVFDDGTTYPIPYIFKGIVGRHCFFKTFMKEHDFILSKKDIAYLIFEELEFIGAVLNDDDASKPSLEMVMLPTDQELQDIKTLSKKYHTENGF